MDYRFSPFQNDRIDDDGAVANVFSEMFLPFHLNGMEGKDSRIFRLIYSGPEKLLSAVTWFFLRSIHRQGQR